MDGRDIPHLEIAGYVLGKLDPAETAAFEVHLAGCARCQQDVENLECLPGLLAKMLPVRPAPSGLRARVLLAVRAAAEAEAWLPVDRGPSPPGSGPGASATSSP